MEDTVQSFLNRFHGDATEVFTNGCCYWFALILFRRFIRDGAEIVYDIIDNHFATKINGRVYDITGDITDKTHLWISWNEYKDTAHKDRISRDCIQF